MEHLQVSPEILIKSLHGIYGKYPQYSGGCLKLHLLLKEIYVHAYGFYNGDHVITLIGNGFYDINGKVDNVKDFLPFRSFGYEYFLSAFSNVLDEHYTNLYIKHYEPKRIQQQRTLFESY